MENKALAYTLKLLSKKDYSEYEIRQKLISREYDQTQVEKVITFLRSKLFLDDKKFAQNYYKNHLQRGTLRIRFELRQKGISDEIITELISSIDNDDQLKKAKEVALKWVKNKGNKYQESYKLKQNLLAKLSRQGFEYDVIIEAIEDLEREGLYGFK